jgi:hypothetical protein
LAQLAVNIIEVLSRTARHGRTLPEFLDVTASGAPTVSATSSGHVLHLPPDWQHE